MDLYDYKDVAENYDRYLAVMYESENHYEHFEEFIEFEGGECFAFIVTSVCFGPRGMRRHPLIFL